LQSTQIITVFDLILSGGGRRGGRWQYNRGGRGRGGRPYRQY